MDVGWPFDRGQCGRKAKRAFMTEVVVGGGEAESWNEEESVLSELEVVMSVFKWASHSKWRRNVIKERLGKQF